MVDSTPELKNVYRNIYIVDSLDIWGVNDFDFNTEDDLVLTFDLALQKKLNGRCDCYYVDHLIGQTRMEENNYRIYRFFQAWHNNAFGKDLFHYRGVDFGISFRMDFWNDYTYYLKLYLCLAELKNVDSKSIVVASHNKVLHKVLIDLDLKFDVVKSLNESKVFFYFPIDQYLNDKIRPTGLRNILLKSRALVSNVYGTMLLYFDKIFINKTTKTIFVEEYHPTKKIISNLRKQQGTNVLLCNFSRNESWINNLKERLLPLLGSEATFEGVAQELLSGFNTERCQTLILDNGHDLTDIAFSIIINRIENQLAKKLSILDSCVNYLNANPIDLSIIVSNIGESSTLFDLACKSNGIPSYLIINGLLGVDYIDESKYATFINSYSVSIKNNYFKGMDNIVVLGDPRMDVYASIDQNKINRVTPTIVIGASGYSPIDLNSYVAIEFDFMHDVLSALDRIKKSGGPITIIIKVRPNGYREQYKKFVDKFFPGLVDNIISAQPMVEVLKKADLYISINSQTLFEASCMGIPVIYYKKDNEILPPPFNNNQDLVTVSTVSDMEQAINDFKDDSGIFKTFLDKKIMEKYVGFIDGLNTKRNLDFINKLIE